MILGFKTFLEVCLRCFYLACNLHKVIADLKGYICIETVVFYEWGAGGNRKIWFYQMS